MLFLKIDRNQIRIHILPSNLGFQLLSITFLSLCVAGLVSLLQSQFNFFLTFHNYLDNIKFLVFINKTIFLVFHGLFFHAFTSPNLDDFKESNRSCSFAMWSVTLTQCYPPGTLYQTSYLMGHGAEWFTDAPFTVYEIIQDKIKEKRMEGGTILRISNKREYHTTQIP